MNSCYGQTIETVRKILNERKIGNEEIARY